MATLENTSWRWRRDNANEISASWYEPANTQYNFDLGNTARLRFLVQETEGVAASSVSPSVEFIQNYHPKNLTNDWSNPMYAGASSLYHRAHLFADNKYCLIFSEGTTAHYAYSTDGVNWTRYAITTGNNWLINSIAYNGTHWVSVTGGASGSGRYFISSDFTNSSGWTTGTINTSFYADRIIYANGYFVAVGYDETAGQFDRSWGRIYTSTNGTTWSLNNSYPTTNSGINGIAYHNGVFALVRNVDNVPERRIYTATDPSGTWTDRGIVPVGAGIIYHEYYDLWVVFGLTIISYTSDPIGGIWTTKTISVSSNLFGKYTITAGKYIISVERDTGVYISDITSDTVTRNVATGFYYGIGIRPAIMVNPANGKIIVGAHSASPTSQYLIWRGDASYWRNFTTSSSLIKAYDSTHLTSGADTTQQLGVGTFITDNNGVSETGTAGPTNFSGNDEAEYEYTIEFLTSGYVRGDEFAFRLKPTADMIWTPAIETIISEPLTKLPMPTNLQVSSISSTQATVSWTWSET